MSTATFRFGPFLVDRELYRVQRGDQNVELTPKLLDLLIHLLVHAGSLVTKEDLLNALWPDANVTENALAQAVSELRQAIGDDAASPTYIKTVARRGYRFIAPVTKGESRTEMASAIDLPAASASLTPAIAVMDFTNVGGDAEFNWLSAGIAETVTGDLRALDHYRVVDRGRVIEAIRRTTGSLEDVARDLQARFAVVGSYQQHGDRIRITARVVDVTSGEALADAKVDGPMAEIFELQDRIVEQLAKELGINAEPHAARLAVRDTSSLEAFRAFTEGTLRLESLDIREMPTAIADFERAVAIDPRYALAHTGLANAEYALYETTRSDNEPDDVLLKKAIQHARQAVELDEGLAEAHATLALLLVSAWKTPEAAASARRAVALEPTNWRHLFRLGHATWGEARLHAATATLSLYPDFAFAHFQMAMVYVARSQLSQAETVLRQGADVQDRQIGNKERYPALGLHWLLGLVRLAQGHIDDAVREFDRELELAHPHRLYGREFALHSLHGRATAQLTAKKYEAALGDFSRALELYPDHAESHLGLASINRSRKSGTASDPLARVEEILKILDRTRPIQAAIVRAKFHVHQGELEAAAHVLRELVLQAPPGFAAWTLPVEPLLSQVIDNANFKDIVDRLNERAG